MGHPSRSGIWSDAVISKCPMTLTARERAKREEFDLQYRRGLLPAMQAIERAVCGCDYGGTSWTTRAEADWIATALGLRAGVALLEIGAGSGWPALYLADASGCDVVLTDVPVEGLGTARERAARDALSDRCLAMCADAAHLPLEDDSFNVINHSDVLCCLVEKRKVLSECLRVLRPDGRMAFSVIYIPSGLPPEDHSRALETAPEFVEADADYPTLLAETGWALLERADLTETFMESCQRTLRHEAERRPELEPQLGRAELEARQDKFRRRVPVLERGHLCRELYLVAPAARGAESR